MVAEKLAAYATLADDHFDSSNYQEFCEAHLAEVDEAMVGYVESSEFDRLLVETVRDAFPTHEHDAFIAHYRGLLGAWVADQSASGPG